MKKILTVLLVLCLAYTGLYAGNFRVGTEVGWGFDIFRTRSSDYCPKRDLSSSSNLKPEYTKILLTNSGFSVNLVGEYAFTKNWGIKASIGFMFAGKEKLNFELKAVDVTGFPSQSVNLNEEYTSGIRSGKYFDFVFDGKYSLNITEKLSISMLFGVEIFLGNLIFEMDSTEKLERNSKRFAFGVNITVEVSYMVIENLRINFGAAFASFFLDKCDFTKELINHATTTMSDLASYSSYKQFTGGFYIRPYVGATYAF